MTLADGTKVSEGDRIITRNNDRRLRISRTNWVKNGDRWHVKRVNADGSLTVVHDQLNKTITLPAHYVSQTVQLGYATTVHGAQGITTGTCHVVLTGDEDRNLLYVALSRGKFANHLYLNVASDGDPHNLIRPDGAYDWTRRFDDAAREIMTTDPGRAASLEHHPDFALAHPTPDHFIPLLYIAGLAAAGGAPTHSLIDGCAMGSLSMASYGLVVAAPAVADGVGVNQSTAPPEQSNL